MSVDESVVLDGVAPSHNYQGLPTGTVLNARYEITAQIGSGGFGIVYEVRDLQSEGDVLAIKEYFPRDVCHRAQGNTLRPHSLQVQDTFDDGLKAFLGEARLLCDLEHSNIVRVFHWFKENGTVYIIMRRLRGRTLEDYIDSGEAPDESTLTKWTAAILSALDIIHSRGFLHRDLSPSNIFIVSGVGPVLIDFGAARQSVGHASQRLTAIARIGYTPPEQYDEHGLQEQTAATDLYALGATLYHVTSGIKPIASVLRGTSTSDRLRPAKEVVAGKYSAAFLATIDKAMAIPQSDRWKSAADWQNTLEPLSKHAPKAGTSKANRWALGIALAIVTLIIFANMMEAKDALNNAKNTIVAQQTELVRRQATIDDQTEKLTRASSIQQQLQESQNSQVASLTAKLAGQESQVSDLNAKLAWEQTNWGPNTALAGWAKAGGSACIAQFKTVFQSVLGTAEVGPWVEGRSNQCRVSAYCFNVTLNQLTPYVYYVACARQGNADQVRDAILDRFKQLDR